MSRRRKVSRKKISRKKRAQISRKIRILMREGYPQRQAIAIAHRMAGVPRKRKHGSKRRVARRKFKGSRRNMTFPWLTEAQVARLSDDQIMNMATHTGALY